MCRILGRKLPGPEIKVLSGTRLGVERSPGADRLVTDSAECYNLTGVSSLSLALSSFATIRWYRRVKQGFANLPVGYNVGSYFHHVGYVVL
jgi:hypothetical protein